VSFTRNITLWCDHCYVWERFEDMTAAKARRQAKRIGWMNNGAKDYCSAECAASAAGDTQGALHG
jgi:hypothetical protein